MMMSRLNRIAPFGLVVPLLLLIAILLPGLLQQPDYLRSVTQEAIEQRPGLFVEHGGFQNEPGASRTNCGANQTPLERKRKPPFALEPIASQKKPVLFHTFDQSDQREDFPMKRLTSEGSFELDRKSNRKRTMPQTAELMHILAKPGREENKYTLPLLPLPGSQFDRPTPKRRLFPFKISTSGEDGARFPRPQLITDSDWNPIVRPAHLSEKPNNKQEEIVEMDLLSKFREVRPDNPTCDLRESGGQSSGLFVRRRPRVNKSVEMWIGHESHFPGDSNEGTVHAKAIDKVKTIGAVRADKSTSNVSWMGSYTTSHSKELEPMSNIRKLGRGVQKASSINASNKLQLVDYTDRLPSLERKRQFEKTPEPLFGHKSHILGAPKKEENHLGAIDETSTLGAVRADRSPIRFPFLIDENSSKQLSKFGIVSRVQGLPPPFKIAVDLEEITSDPVVGSYLPNNLEPFPKIKKVVQKVGQPKGSFSTWDRPKQVDENNQVTNIKRKQQFEKSSEFLLKQESYLQESPKKNKNHIEADERFSQLGTVISARSKIKFPFSLDENSLNRVLNCGPISGNYLLNSKDLELLPGSKKHGQEVAKKSSSISTFNSLKMVDDTENLPLPKRKKRFKKSGKVLLGKQRCLSSIANQEETHKAAINKFSSHGAVRAQMSEARFPFLLDENSPKQLSNLQPVLWVPESKTAGRRAIKSVNSHNFPSGSYILNDLDPHYKSKKYGQGLRINACPNINFKETQLLAENEKIPFPKGKIKLKTPTKLLSGNESHLSRSSKKKSKSAEIQNKLFKIRAHILKERFPFLLDENSNSGKTNYLP